MDTTKNNARLGAGVDVSRHGRVTPTLQNAGLDYAPLDELVQANIDGQRRASNFLAGIQSYYAHPDTLYLELKSVLPDSLHSECLANLRGFARCIQKRLETSS